MTASDPNEIVEDNAVPTVRKPRPANFVVFRTVESLIFAAPIVAAFFQDSVFVFLLTVAICALLYSLWARYIKRHMSEDHVESYETVYDESKTRVFTLSDLVPLRIWLLWIAVLVWSLLFL